MQEPPPLILCLEKDNGEEVSVQINPGDDFNCFLRKAKDLLGYDIDINSVTRNEPVSLTDDIYQFLIKNEKGLAAEVFNALNPSVNNEDYYVLEDGTQIRASQIHFDNEDPPVDFITENIPFVKFNDVNDNVEIHDPAAYETKYYNITASPVRFPKDSMPFFIPFKLIPNYNKKPSGFEAQYLKYLDKNYVNRKSVTNRNKSQKSLIRENFKKHNENYNYQRNNTDLNHYTREDIINIYKDCAATTYEKTRFLEKRRHVRKSNPSRLFHKNLEKPSPYIDGKGMLVTDIEFQKCIVCSKYVQTSLDKLHIFDSEDQRVHGNCKLKTTDMHSKIICAQCLAINFKLARVKGPKKYLRTNEYLVIRNGKQYIFEKTNPEVLKRTNNDETKCNDDINSEVKVPKPNSSYNNNMIDKSENVKVELGTIIDGEIVKAGAIEKVGEIVKDEETETKQVNEREDSLIVKDERKESSSDVEIIENVLEFGNIENLEEVDEEVIEFLGKYQCDRDIKELKCRFCEKLFNEINEVIDHGTEHKHDLDDSVVFPCPLCDYGYDDIKWLKGHLKAAHDKSRVVKMENKDDIEKQEDEHKEPGGAEDSLQTNIAESNMLIKTEVKQEALESSDDDVWIVQTADDEAERQLNVLLHSAKKSNPEKLICDVCSQVFRSVEAHNTHKCYPNRRSRKRKSRNEDIIVACSEDFLRRAQGKIRTFIECDDDNDLVVLRPKKKRSNEPSSDLQIVTCHNCNQSFTSKVRLKFHMQFHDTTNMLTPEGEYKCAVCDGMTFQSETALFDHVHFQHDKQPRWQCPVTGCEKIFYLRATLTKHSRMHTDTRRYVCVTCGKKFLDKQTLDEHGVTHLQSKPYQCHICFKQLTRRSRLRMHLRAHEEELVPTLVLGCAVCGRAFRGAADVQEHLTNFPECIEEFTKELKQEESVTVQLSPTTGIVRHSVQVEESPRLSMAVPFQATGPKAEALLNEISEAARSIIRCLLIEKAFRCEYCEDVFYSELGLNTHRAIHKGVKNPFVCHICKVSFTTYSRCTTHKTTHGFYRRSLAEVKKEQVKSIQDTQPTSSRILGYGDFPVVKHFLCQECGRSYLHWTYLQVHRRMKHPAVRYVYRCEHCDITYPNSWSLAYHRKKRHSTKTDQGQGPVTDKQKDELLFRIKCRDCEETFTNNTALYKHRRKQHCGNTLQDNGGNYNPDQSLFPYASGATCDTKPSGFHNQTQTQEENKDDDTTVVQFVCEVCTRGFPTRTELTVHARAHAPNAVTAQGLRVHMCGWCQRAFATQSALAEHVRTHTGARPFVCDVCGVGFRRLTAMRNHRLIHSAVQAFACAQCPKKFRLRSDLVTHYRVKHPSALVVKEGMSSFTPTTAPLEMLSNNPHTQTASCEPNQPDFRGLGIARSTPNILTPNKSIVSNLPNVSHISNVHSVSYIPSVSKMPKMSTFTNMPISNIPRMSTYMSNISNMPRKKSLTHMSNSNTLRMTRKSNITNMTRMSTFTNLRNVPNIPKMTDFQSIHNSSNILNLSTDNTFKIPYELRLLPNTYNYMSTMPNYIPNVTSTMTNVSCADMSNVSCTADMSNVTYADMQNVSCADMPNVSCADMSNVSCAVMSNVTYTDMQNVPCCSADMPNVSCSADISNVPCADMPKVSCPDMSNVTYTDMQNVPCSADMPNVSCSADISNVPCADMPKVSCPDMSNVTYTDMSNVSCTADMPNVSCADMSNVTYTDMQNVPCTADMSNVSCYADMPNVSCADMSNVTYTDMQNVPCTADMSNVSCAADMSNVRPEHNY